MLTLPEAQSPVDVPESTKPYATPKLKILGTLDDLTQFSADGFVPDGDPSNNGFSLS